MISIEEAISARIQRLTVLLTEKRKALREAPDGIIRIEKRGEHQYYHYRKGTGKWRYLRLGDSRDMQLAQAVVQRSYDEKVVKRAVQEIEVLNQVKTLYDAGAAENIFEKIPETRRRFIHPITLDDEEFGACWLAEKQKLKEKRDSSRVCRNQVTFTTKNGEKVKSKSEKMIADMLLDQKKRYIYEFPVEVVDHKTGRRYTAHPDFLVLNARTRKAYFYEHFGKMDDPEYAEENIGKMIDYRNAGIMPGENMIATFETRADPLTPESVQTVIDTFLS